MRRLPFSDAPVQAARAVRSLPASDLDQRRALLCLTQAVYYEAGYRAAGGPPRGRPGRAQPDAPPGLSRSRCAASSISAISTPVCQFSFVCDGSLLPRARPRRRGSRPKASPRGARRLCRARRWARRPIITPIMSRRAGRRCWPRSRKLGAHIFYRWPGAWGQPAAFTGRYIGEPRDPAVAAPDTSSLAIAPNGDGRRRRSPPDRRSRARRNDVGGLLDTSKGWTLNIPMPRTRAAARRKRIAEQQARRQRPTEVAAAATRPRHRRCAMRAAARSGVERKSWQPFPFFRPATQAPPAADRLAADHRRLGGRLRSVPDLGDARQGRRSDQRAGQGHPDRARCS